MVRRGALWGSAVRTVRCGEAQCVAPLRVMSRGRETEQGVVHAAMTGLFSDSAIEELVSKVYLGMIKSDLRSEELKKGFSARKE